MASILALGGAHIDRRGRISGVTAPAASNPGTWREEAGGGVFNVARNLARLGHRVTLVSPRGGDAEGEAVAAAAEIAGVIDRPVIFLDRRTPTYTAILERDGNLVIALADMELYRMFSPRRLQVRAFRDELAAADLVVCDANLPEETLQALGRLADAHARPLAAIGISPAKVVRLRSSLRYISYLFMNEAEARALGECDVAEHRDWPSVFRALGLPGGAVTRGASETIGWMRAEIACLKPPPLTAIGDVTGAGDGFAAGFLHASLAGATLGDCLRTAAASARLCLKSEMATAEDMSHALLADTMTLVPEAEILL